MSPCQMLGQLVRSDFGHVSATIWHAEAFAVYGACCCVHPVVGGNVGKTTTNPTAASAVVHTIIRVAQAARQSSEALADEAPCRATVDL